MIKAVIFDYGGVIGINTMPFIHEALAKEFKLNASKVENGIKKTRKEFQKGDITENEFWRELAKILGADNSESVKNIWTKTYISKNKTDYSVLEIAKKLKKKGYKVALLSNAIKPDIERCIDAKGLDKIFSPIIYSFETRMRKPDAEIYNLILSKLKMKPDECVFIDDKRLNLETAEKLGINAILFENSRQLKNNLDKILKQSGENVV